MYYYVYVLLSRKDGKRYVGYTTNLQERFEAHNKGRVDSTRDRRPLALIYYEASKDKYDAIHREKYLKTYHGKRFIDQRLKSFLTG